MVTKTKPFDQKKYKGLILEIKRAVVLVLIGFVVSTIFSHGCHSTPHEDEELCVDRLNEPKSRAK